MKLRNQLLAHGDLHEALQRYRNMQKLIDTSPAAFAELTDSIQEQIEQLDLGILLGHDQIDYSALPFSGEKYRASFFFTETGGSKLSRVA